MDTTPLPSQDSDLSDSGSESEHTLLSTYVIRITPCDKFTFKQLCDFIKDESIIYNYVISREIVPREHFHLVVQCDIEISLQDVRDVVRAFLLPYWTTLGKLPVGFGNKQYNLQDCKDLDKAVSYAVKQDEYVFEGFTEEYIALRRAESFEKKKPSNFKSEYLDLTKRFQESTMDVREFMIHYCNLKAKYDQMVNMNHAYAYAISNEIKRDKNAADFVENFLYKQ